MDTSDDDELLLKPKPDVEPETDDPLRIIELADHRNPKHGKRRPNAGGKSHPDQYKRMLQDVVTNATAAEAAKLTDAELEFVDLVVGGTSVSEALVLTHPDKCFVRERNGHEFKLGADGKPIPLNTEQLWERGNKLVNTTRIRARMKQLLEQEMLDSRHTSLVIHNFVLKRYIIEASTAKTASARIAALDRLKEYGAVAAREAEQTQHAETPEQVKAEIEALLKRLGV